MILQYYTDASLSLKIFIWLRLLSCPFNKLIKLLPKSGNILDIGCGYGLLTLLLLKSGFSGKINAIDLDKERIEKAKKATNGFKNISFVSGTLDSFKTNQKFSIITLIDVLYLLPINEKLKILKKANTLLTNGGRLIIKINDRAATLPFFLTWIQEQMTVHVLKKTSTKHSGLYFENTNDLKQWLIESGFKVEKVVRLPTPFPFFHPHNLIIAVK